MRDNVNRLGLTAAAYWIYSVAAAGNPWTLIANARIKRRGAPDRLPIPPADLIFLVAGSADISWFLEGGALAASSVTEALRAAGVAVGGLAEILDFGCGCGRVLRYWRALSNTRVHGTDVNPRLVEWTQKNLPFVEARGNRLSPPLDYEDSQFDLVYALSVFTHLTQALQTAWIDELARVVKPGGHLLISTHGESYLGRLTAAERLRFMSGELVVKNNTSAPGSNTCSAYHPLAYVRNQLAEGLEMTAFIREGAKGNPSQDLYVLRKPSRSTT